MRRNIIKDKSFSFAIEVVNCYKYLTQNKKEYVLSRQFLRSGTAIGALYREAEYAESKKDFIHKLSIAQKECNEALYWLDLLHETSYLNNEEYTKLNNKATSLIKLLTSIIKTTNNNY